MNIEYEQYYCRTCNKLFNDIVHRPYYTRNNFVDNQACLIYNLKYKHEMKKSNYHSQCPHCYSKHVVNVNDILSGKLIIRSKKIAEATDKKMLKCLGEWLKFYNEISGYHLLKVANKYVLYDDMHNIKRNIKRALAMRTKHLNIIKNK